jgi:hypothetical protein
MLSTAPPAHAGGAPAADANAAVNWQDIGTSRWQLNHHATSLVRGLKAPRWRVM